MEKIISGTQGYIWDDKIRVFWGADKNGQNTGHVVNYGVNALNDELLVQRTVNLTCSYILL